MGFKNIAIVLAHFECLSHCCVVLLYIHTLHKKMLQALLIEMGEREAETEEGIGMIGRAAGTEIEMTGTGVGVEVEREIEEKIATGIMIMTEIETMGGKGTVIVIGTGTGTVIEKRRNL